MLVKCICTNCAGHLEFEEENAGRKIPCPHCGFETVLTLPGTEPVDSEAVAAFQQLRRRRLIIRAAAALLALGAAGWALYHWGVPWVQDFWPAVDTTLKAIIVLILLCLFLPLAIFWLLFPVLLWLQLRKLNQAVARLAPAPAPEPSEEQEEEEEEEETPTPGSADQTRENVKAAAPAPVAKG